MIINWTDKRVLIIPVVSGKKDVPAQTGSLTLIPGCNDIDTEIWKSVRKSVSKKLANKQMIEEYASLENDQLIVKEFHELTAQQAVEIVKKTYSTATLTRERKKSRESVRIVILNQIEYVENYGIKKEKNELEIT